jgi:hypothetical protein
MNEENNDPGHRDEQFQQTLISKIPNFVWGIVATLFALMLTLNLSGLNFGTAMNVIAFAYAEKYKKRSELNLKSDVEIQFLIQNITRRIEKLEKDSHPHAPKRRIKK